MGDLPIFALLAAVAAVLGVALGRRIARIAGPAVDRLADDQEDGPR